MELTSRQRRIVAEADMSRRDFLKLTGKAAAAAAAPQSALKGLMGGAPGTQAMQLPANPNACFAALIKWAKDTGKYQEWYNLCIKYYKDTAKDYGLQTKEQIEKAAVTRINDWAAWNAMEPNETDRNDSLDALNWALWNGRWGNAADRLPDWITRYRLKSWVGKDVGPNHPFIKDRDKWELLINGLSTGRIGAVDPTAKAEFLDIIKDTLDPQRVQKVVSDLNRRFGLYKSLGAEEPVTDDNKYSTQAEKDAAEQDIGSADNRDRKEGAEDDEQIPDEPDSWRTQSVRIRV